MTQPLALIWYEKLLPGSQLVNRLQDLNYRVQTVSEAATLSACAEEAKPMVVLVDLHSTRADVCAAIAALKKNPSTQHLPVIAFGGQNAPETQAAAAQAAGVTLLVNDVAILNHLPECLEQALRVD